MDILANERFINSVTEKVRGGTVHHAYLFTGPDGSGKKTLAGFLARLLCCGEKNAPCGRCAACRKIAAGVHPDVHVLEKRASEPSLKVDAVRDFLESIDLAPNEAPYKIYVVRDAQTMTKEAQNVLLKTLEEPVGRTVFMLLSTSEAALLPTVRSRCVTVAAEAVGERALTDYLVKRCKVDEETAAKAARLAGGYVGAACAMLEKKGGFETKDTAVEFLRRIASSDKAGAAALLSGKYLAKDKLPAIYLFLQLAMRAVAARDTEGFFDAAEDAEQIKRKFTPAKAIAFHDLLENEKAIIARNGNPQLSVLRVVTAV